ncbi:MAG: DUF5050 domain-containing protein [Leptolinea sp.]
MEKLVGRVLNERYQIEEALGSSEMADIYRAVDIHRSTNILLKHLKENYSKDPVFLQSFKQEANQLKLLLHPNIVRFHGLEEAGNQVFMLIDFVEGITLRKAILSANAIPFTTPEIMEIMQPVCIALHYAHQMGIVHGDLKPANIIIEKSGWVQVTNFGLALQAAGATTPTIASLGTSAYKAPEQVKGLDPTPQTDIYALGLVLFEMLTGGERPFTRGVAAGTGSTKENIRREQVNLKPVSPRRFNPQISEHLERVTLKCLEKEPGSRFSSTLELLEALQTPQYVRVTPATTVPKVKPTQPAAETSTEIDSFPAPGAKWKPNLNLYLAGGALIIFLLLIILIRPFAVIKPENSPIQATQISGTIPEIQNTPIPEPSISIGAPATQANSGSTPQATVAATSNPSAIPDSALEENRNGTGNSNNSGLAAIQGDWIYYRNDSDGGKIYRINLDGSKKEQLNSDNSYNITVSGDWVFYRNDSDAGKLYRIPVNGGERKKLNEEFSAYIFPAGEWIYYQNHTGGDTIHRVRMDGSGREKLTDGQSSFISVYKDRVYFVNDSDGHKIYRMQLDGSIKEKITDDFCSHLNVFGDRLYYITRNLIFDPRNSSWSTESTTINRMQLDGSGKEVLSTTKNGSINGYINVLGDQLFFIPEISYFSDKNSNNVNIGGLMYRVRLGESKRETINESGCNSINIVGDWIYYRKGGLGGKIFRMHLDGSGKESIS